MFNIGHIVTFFAKLWFKTICANGGLFVHERLYVQSRAVAIAHARWGRIKWPAPRVTVAGGVQIDAAAMRRAVAASGKLVIRAHQRPAALR